MENQQSEFVPFGNLNQDDSIVTPLPTPNGIKSPFQLGDYRYALNLRLGSSRNNNFGDAENIRGTIKSTLYNTLQQVILNPEFTGSLTNWNQLDQGSSYKPWVYGSNTARLTIVPDTTTVNSGGTTTFYAVQSFQAPTDSTNYPAFAFTQVNILQSNLFSINQTITFTGATHYTSGYVVVVGSGYLIIQHTFAGNDLGVTIGVTTGGSTVTTTVATPFISQVLYQTIIPVIESKQNGIHIDLLVTGGVISNGAISLVYMDGATIISEQILSGGGIGSFVYNSFVTPPANCDGLGFRISGTVSDITTFDIVYFKDVISLPGIKPAGAEIVIGKYNDYEFQRIYEFVWNENLDHTIRYYDPSVNTTFELLRWSGLKFQSNYFVKSAKLDNWIAFTDRNNAPRLIDTNTIGDLFNTIGESNFREFHISHHKWAPVMPPIPRVFYDNVTNNYEILKNKAYQFAFQYIYKGNLRSRFSPISKAAVTASCGFYYNNTVDKKITSIEVDIPGMILDVPGANTQYNYFGHTDVKFINSVDAIVLAYREGELDLWKIWKTVPITGTVARLHYYSGDANNTPIPQEDFDQLFDTVPFLAGTVEAIDNRFVYGDCLNEQQPLTDFAVTNLGVVTSGPDNSWESSNVAGSGFSSFTADQLQDVLRRNSLSQFSFKSRGKYKTCIQFLHHTGWRSAGYTSDDFGYNATDVQQNVQYGTKLLGFNFKIPGNIVPPDWAIAYQVMRTNVLNIDFFMFGIVNQFIPLIDSINVILDRISIPDGTKKVIQDHFANAKLISGYDVASFSEKAIQDEIDARARSYAKDGWNKILKLNENIGKLSGSPSLALSNHELNENLRHNPMQGDLSAEILKVEAINLITSSSRIMIDINNWYNASKQSPTVDNPINKLYYNYRVGDRVRFPGSSVANPSNPSQIKTYDVNIISFTGKGILIERPADLAWVPGFTTSGTAVVDFFIEVYTPKIPNSADFFFFEMGEVYPILYPGTINRDFAKRDWVYTANSDVTAVTYGPFNIFNKLPLYYADCLAVGKNVFRDYLPLLQFPGPQSGYTGLGMNPDPDMNYDYWDRYNGRPTITYKDLPPFKFITTQARFSGKIVEQSLINQLNRFNDTDQKIYPSEYGRIRNFVNTANAQVESVGAILLAIGEREAWSVYVNRTTLEDLSGHTQVLVSDQVLGSYNTLLGSHGTLNPESVSVYRGRVYWWDGIKGSWIRYGRDGLTPISDYKMRNWFREIGSLLISTYLTSETPKVISEYDSFNEELVTYIDHSTLPATFRGYNTYKGAVFSEKDTGWKNIHSYTPELFAHMNNQLISFKNGDVYLHELNDAYNTFYGTKYDSKIEPVFNDAFASVKHWQTITTLSTNKWSAERILSEYRGLRSLIESRIDITHFEEREDTYWAAIKRDLNTPNVADPIINGQVVRSKSIQVLLTLDPGVAYLSLLHAVFAGFIESPKNP